MTNQLVFNSLGGTQFVLGEWKVSTIGQLNDDVPSNPEVFNKIIEIVRNRLKSEQHEQVSLAIRADNFLPVSFLEAGVQQSLAICRIARYFSLPNFTRFIEGIEISLAASGNEDDNFATFDKVIEMFSIPEQVAENLLSREADQSNMTSGQSTPLGILKTISESELAKANPIPIGTGFLVGGNHLLTNHHVVSSCDIAEQCVAQFNYVEPGRNTRQTSTDYDLDPKLLFISEPSLDYTLVQLKSEMFTRQAGYEFGWCQLIEDEEVIQPRLNRVEFIGKAEAISRILQAERHTIKQLEEKGYIVLADETSIQIWHPQQDFDSIGTELQKLGTELQKLSQLPGDSETWPLPGIKSKPGDAAIIIQHPKGKQKKIVLNDNEVMNLYQNVVQYKSDSDYGSSGSPVFNRSWQVVGLHHAVILDKTSSARDKQVMKATVQQQGIRICRIIEDLKRKSFSDSKLKSFIQDFVTTAEQLNYPPFSNALKFDGLNDYILSPIKKGNLTALTVEAWVQIQPVKANLTLFTLFYKEPWATNDSTLGDRTLSVSLSKQGSVKSSRSLSFNSYPESSLLYPPRCLSLFYPKVYPSRKYGLLERGDTGFRVLEFKRFFQIVLSSINYFSGSSLIDEKINVIENEFDEQTERAVKAFQTTFQESHGLASDGLVGPLTLDVMWKLLRFEKNYVGVGVEELCTLLCQDGYNKEGRSLLERLQQAKNTFNDDVMQVVKQFQRESQGKQSSENQGIVDYLTLDALWGFGLYLREGNRGQSVKDLQHLLRDISASLEPSGVFDTATFEAVKKMQEEEGLKPDGVVGSLLLDSLKKPKISTTKDGVISESQFSHVAITFNSIKSRLWVNGEAVDFRAENDKPEKISGKDFRFLIGAYSNSISKISNNTLSDCFRGAITEFRAWDRDHTETEIRKTLHCRIRRDENGLLEYWPFEQQDKGNQPFPASIEKDNTSWLRASQYPALPLPFALKFSNSGDCVDCGDGMDLSVKDAITVEAWVKHRFGNCQIVNRLDSANGYSLSWQDGRIHVILRSLESGETTGETTIVATKDSILADQAWHHVAFTWDSKEKDSKEKSSKEVSIYVDGKRQDSIVVQGQSKAILFQGRSETIGLFNGSLVQAETNLTIGSKTPRESYYNIAITDVRLWNVCRPQNQIKANMSRRLDSEKERENGLIGYWRLDEGINDLLTNLVSKTPAAIRGATWFPMPTLPKQMITAAAEAKPSES
jgi:peptidoglycan hydrolase-like protein with peptidoglycan-binding domain